MMFGGSGRTTKNTLCENVFPYPSCLTRFGAIDRKVAGMSSDFGRASSARARRTARVRSACGLLRQVCP